MLQTFSTENWDQQLADTEKKFAVNKLEAGKILFFPSLGFQLTEPEQQFFSPEYIDPHAKNISYHAISRKLWGVQHLSDNEHLQLKKMLDRFCHSALQFVRELFPKYAPHLILARTSFRPVQISGRKTSYRKDDKRLHIDAFPSAPNQGKRILRVFTNVNPEGADRVWRVGENFKNVAQRFLPQIKKPFLGKASLLRLFRITKSYRTLYDHYMLQIHDRMKADDEYQKKAQQEQIQFPAGSSWIVQTDHVSHAAMLGQFVLEQTFYLPVIAMEEQERSPLHILERMLRIKLV